MTLLLSLGCSHASDSSPVAFDPSFLDHTAAPCEDFYQYACGTWLAQHPSLPGYAAERFQTGDDRDDIYFWQLVEAMASSDPNLVSAQSYYAQCLNVRTLGFAQADQLTQDLAQIAALSSTTDLPTTLGHLQSHGVHAIMVTVPEIDPGDPTRYLLDISDYGWSLPARASYLDSNLAAAYRAHMTALTAAAKTASASLTLDPDAVFALEASIAAAGNDDTDPVARYNPTDLTALASQLPGFDWGLYFGALGFPAVTEVNLDEPSYLTNVAAILASASLDTVKQYLEWRVLEADASYIDQPLGDEEFTFHRTVVAGQQKQPSQDEYSCLLATRDAFGFDLARHFVESFVPGNVKPQATDFVSAIQAAMSANLTRVGWLDDDTRAAALKKAQALLPKVGYPDPWPSDPIDLSRSMTYLSQVTTLRLHSQELAIAALHSTVDRTQFWASPEITNAFYSPTRNDITIPVAVLQDPFFRAGGQSAFNFGTLGTVVGHELTHALDSSGRHFDGEGKLSDWWTAPTAVEFGRRSQCLVDQFSGYEAAPGVPIDGQRTLNENIADLGGVKLAYAAFEAEGHADSSPDFSAEQQFFVSFAQLWCSSISDEAAALLVTTDRHSPPKFRVNGVLRNLPQFAAAFSCPAGAPLAPADRCEIW